MLKTLPLLYLAPVLAACQPFPSTESTASSPGSGHAFAQARCGGCHAVETYGTSPNRNAPVFGAIVNREGLTAETLSSWLRDAHNYPEEMRFQLGPSEADRLVAYMLTLRDPNYRRPVQ